MFIDTRRKSDQTTHHNIPVLFKMKTSICSRIIFTFVLFLMISPLFSALEHDKSFQLQDGGTMVYSIALFKDSLLLTSSSDIVEKDTKTGAVVRTFSAHTSTVVGIIVTNASEMITSGLDNMIIVWSLETGAVLKRIWVGSLNTQVESISWQNNQLFTGGLDGKVRQIDLITGKVVQTFNMGVQVYAAFVLENYLYVGKFYLGPPVEKYHYPSSTLLISFEGHADTVLSLYATDSLLFSGSFDKSIICWNSENGQLLRTFWLHPASVTALVVIENVLYSGDFKGFVIKWKIDNGEVLHVFPRTNINFVRTFAWKYQELYSGSGDATVVKWNLTAGEPIAIFAGRNRVLRSAVLWNNLVIDAGDNEEIRAWDTSINSVEPFRTLTEHTGSINCLLVCEDFLFSGSSDTTVRHWNLTIWSIVRVLTGHTGTISTLTSDDEHLYSAGFDLVIKKWNMLLGTLDSDFFGHTAQITSIDLMGTTLYSGSSDKTIKFWSIETAQAFVSIESKSNCESLF
jgi:WD40 repeat protein